MTNGRRRLVKRKVPASDADCRNSWSGDFIALLIIPVISELSNIPGTLLLENSYQRENPCGSRLLGFRLTRLGPALKKGCLKRSWEFSVSSRESKGSAVKGVAGEARTTFSEQISPLDGDITLESSTNVAFP